VTSCIVDSAAIYIMVVKFRNTICPPHPQLSLHRRAALSSNSNGTRSYIAERTQSAVYIVRCLWHYYPYLLLLRCDNCSAAVFDCVLRCHYDKIKQGVYARLLVSYAKCPSAPDPTLLQTHTLEISKNNIVWISLSASYCHQKFF
jgi:hypothetical protein